MESFLDKLLAGDAGDETRAPGPSPAPPGATAGSAVREGAPDADPGTSPGSGHALPPRGTGAPRIAVYDTLTSPPRVVPVEEGDVPALIAALAEKTYHSCRDQGGNVPYTVINELIENLIHAYFRDVVVTILDGGRVVRISDHGPGVDDKDRAFLPGFTTASAEQRRYIRGVGSGLPVARESLAFLRGAITVEDNLGGGAVFTIRMPERGAPPAAATPPPAHKLTTRQTKILVLLMELNSAGPTALARELRISAATAHRELNLLAEMRLIHSLGDGKRALTDDGLTLLESVLR